MVVNISRSFDAKVVGQTRLRESLLAARLFAEGVAVVQAAPEGCFGAGGEVSADVRVEAGAGEKLQQAGERLRQKADAAAADNTTPQPPGQPGEDRPAADPGQLSQLEQLKDSAREALAERNSGQERDEYLRDDDFGPGVDRPW